MSNKEPNFQDILKAKIDYYGRTEAVYQFAAEEYARQLLLQQTVCSTQVPLTDYDVERLCEWIMDDNRKTSTTAFTSGATRNIASAIELKFQRQKK